MAKSYRCQSHRLIPDFQGGCQDNDSQSRRKEDSDLASVAGTFGAPGSSSYCASKYGTIGLAKTLALELAQYKINVNAINPDTISTNLVDERIVAAAEKEGITVAELLKRRAESPPMGPNIPLGRHGDPGEVADLVYFLVSAQSSYITGQTINIDGGAH